VRQACSSTASHLAAPLLPNMGRPQTDHLPQTYMNRGGGGRGGHLLSVSASSRTTVHAPEPPRSPGGCQSHTLERSFCSACARGQRRSPRRTGGGRSRPWRTTRLMLPPEGAARCLPALPASAASVRTHSQTGTALVPVLPHQCLVRARPQNRQVYDPESSSEVRGCPPCRARCKPQEPAGLRACRTSPGALLTSTSQNLYPAVARATLNVSDAVRLGPR